MKKNIENNLGKYAKKGNIPWNKGKTGIYSEETLKKMSTSHTGKLSEKLKHHLEKINKDKRGVNHPMYGKHHSEESKKKISISRSGIPSWNKMGDGITSKDKLERAKFRKTIQKQVFERDDYTCQMCNSRGVKLQVDHIQPWSEYVELRFDINNCRTLCMACHYEITFGRKIPDNVLSWGHNFSTLNIGEK